MTAISRVFGLVRDVVIANIFGAGAGSDAFFVAFKIPNYLRRLFAEGGFSQAFVPVLAEYKSRGSEDAVQDLIDHVSGRLALILFCVTLIGIVAAPLWIMLFAAGFIGDVDKIQLSIDMLRLTFPYIFFISLTALSGGILNTYGNFFVPALTPVILNICLILAAIFLSPYLDQPVTALAWGILIAGFLQLLFQLPFLRSNGKLPRPRLKRGHEGVSKILNLMLPTLFSTSISQINLIVDMFMASFLVTGSISWLYYSDRLVEFPLGVFGVALATVVLPKLAEKYTQGEADNFSRIMDWALKWVFLLGIPAAIGLMLLAGPILSTIFQYGAFTVFHVEMSAKSLLAYALGLPSFILVKVLANGYFSRQDTRTPVKIGIIAMFANIILNLILIRHFAHAGLALATSLAAFINAGLLFYFLRQRHIYLPGDGWVVFIFRIMFASLVMGVLLYCLPAPMALWVQWDIFNRVWQLALWISVGVTSYFITLWLIGLRSDAMRLSIISE